jgi:hypothetical protein
MTKEIRMPKLVFHLEVPVTFSHLCFDIPSSFGNSIFVIREFDLRHFHAGVSLLHAHG